jgi:hypothetical protein
MLMVEIRQTETFACYKSTQRRDIEAAKKLARELEEE